MLWWCVVSWFGNRIIVLVVIFCLVRVFILCWSWVMWLDVVVVRRVLIFFFRFG